MNLYLRERGDTAIKSNADLIANSKFHDDPTFPDRKRGREPVHLRLGVDVVRLFLWKRLREEGRIGLRIFVADMANSLSADSSKTSASAFRNSLEIGPLMASAAGRACELALLH